MFYYKLYISTSVSIQIVTLLVLHQFSFCVCVCVCEAIQTLTLHVDTTKLDLSHVQPCCHRDQMLRYLDMGLTTEEVVEVSLKLAVLQKLGLHLKIEGLPHTPTSS